MGADHVLINGQLVTAEEATVSVFDLGFLRGIGAFETLRTYNGKPHALQQHLERIQNSIDSLGIDLHLEATAIRKDIQCLYQACQHQELRLNFVVSPGVNTDGLFGSDAATWIIIAKNLQRLPETCYQNGVSAVCFSGQRFLPQLKTTNYLIGRKGYMQAQAAGAHEALYVNEQGFVTEGVTSNLLIIKDRQIIDTLSMNCLPGITKSGLQRLAQQLHIPWQKKNITQEEMYAADEVWISSAVRELVPVISVDGNIIGDGKPGPLANECMPLYHQLCIDDAESDMHTANA
ncbi:MAG: aminotransferase class IV [Planctomycetes bacterium]|nr:aminotransferase class IV [Planctomycetota bacterium]